MAKPFEISNAFKGVLYNLSQLLEDNFDKNLKTLEAKLEKTKNVNHVADNFARRVAKDLFGEDDKMLYAD
ncbi:MAG: hypothetical protein QF475_02770 [Candidatus Undinarchaeales archaeon]|jgi:flagellar motor switch protein FliG|nr:hypothetical protein [Candidatus Undinarchaeales archaeon]